MTSTDLRDLSGGEIADAESSAAGRIFSTPLAAALRRGVFPEGLSESMCGKSVGRVSHFVLSNFFDSSGCANCAIS